MKLSELCALLIIQNVEIHPHPGYLSSSLISTTDALNHFPDRKVICVLPGQRELILHIYLGEN